MGLNLTLDHVNVRTANLQTMLEFYERVLDLRPGPRPHFGGAGGAWLYGEEKIADSLDAVKQNYSAAWVHFIEVDSTDPVHSNLQVEHFAFTATGMGEFLNRLENIDCPFDLADMPDVAMVQVNFRDPDGNHIHVDFPLAEKPPG
ncbi:MAG: VOC family protein [Rhodospirillaceae bacterium]|nr:VOC family protein [Rhodospirillaceae bacterium]